MQFRATPGASGALDAAGARIAFGDTFPGCEEGSWNALEVTVRDGVARAACNGAPSDRSVPAAVEGRLRLESGGGLIELRGLEVKSLP
jgi:hypothetical protein